MDEALIFIVGSMFFIATATATLLFAYLQFNAVYRADQEMEPATKLRIVVGTDERA